MVEPCGVYNFLNELYNVLTKILILCSLAITRSIFDIFHAMALYFDVISEGEQLEVEKNLADIHLNSRQRQIKQYDQIVDI